MSRARIAALAGVAALLAACTSAGAIPTTRDSSTNVPFTGCDQVACVGTIDGADYEIAMPAEWNGTLVIYSHGYSPAQPFPPDFAPVTKLASAAPGWDSGDRSVGEALLERGYAIAGSSYSANGWAVQEGVTAGTQLYEFFRDNIAVPNRVYVWGDSLGGLVTATLAEQGADWVDGAAPMCAVMAGLLPNINLALDAAFAVQQLLFPEMQIVDFASYEDAVAAWEGAASRLVDGARNQDTEAIAKMFTIAAIVDAPAQTFRFDGSGIVSQVSGTVESLLTALGYGTVGRFDIEQRYGGNVSSNEGTDYAARVDEAERERIDSIGGDGAAARFLATLDAAPRVAADPAAAEAALAGGGDPSGAIQDPMITMTTAADPLVIVENESFFRDRYNAAQAAGEVKGGLLQLFTVAPGQYSEETGAPYGAGHCNFTLQSRVAVIELLDRWVREGVYPGQAAIAAAMGPQSGYSPAYQPGPWPNPLAVATQ